jgi:hypothetical protein
MWRWEHDLEPVHSVGEVHIAYETGKSLRTCTLAGIRNTFELGIGTASSEMYGFN